MMIKALYIHIPFCLAKCKYCDFNSYPLPVFKGRVDEYLGALKKELLMLSKEIPLGGIETIYMGGGTPTILDTGQLLNFMKCLKEIVDFSNVDEITIEANPGTITQEKLLALNNVGFNRISIGVQSLDDNLLKHMGRAHNAEEAVAAVTLARETGWSNINVDLIYGLPNQSNAIWMDTLKKVIDLGPDHISAYGLKIEDNTPWSSDYYNNLLALPEEDSVLEMYETLQAILGDNGYFQYEISNYCKPKKASKHNTVYWHNNYYLGIGSGAASFYNNQRFYNIKNTGQYLDCLSQGLRPIGELLELAQEEQISETMFMNLRLLSGIKIVDFKKRFGISPIDKYYNEIKKLSEMELLDVNEDTIKLTHKGIPLANLVFMEFV
ncbi:MAG: hypothetical protein APF76_13700 [Desulfitibacter sp. BRH_c19]|nr:MAG: hypothetical protein APF76_13700 [Desulfitibacter sp. BRH_c19]